MDGACDDGAAAVVLRRGPEARIFSRDGNHFLGCEGWSICLSVCLYCVRARADRLAVGRLTVFVCACMGRVARPGTI